MIDYGQFCTVARGAEVLGELWTPLVVRELLCGSRRFNDIHRGVPRMSATLLTQRLRKLEELGVVERRRADGRWEYHLTQAGEELRPIVVGLGHWGARWIGSRLKARAARRRLPDVGHPPLRAARQVSRGAAHRGPLPFTDAPRGERLWWLVVENRTADLCRDDPGHEVTVVVESTVRALTEVWTGDSDPARRSAPEH